MDESGELVNLVKKAAEAGWPIDELKELNVTQLLKLVYPCDEEPSDG